MRGGDEVEVRETYVTRKARAALAGLAPDVRIEDLMPLEGEHLTVFADNSRYFIWQTGPWRLTFVTPPGMDAARGKFGVVSVQRQIPKTRK